MAWQSCPEARFRKCGVARAPAGGFGFRSSVFGLLSGFGLRTSDLAIWALAYSFRAMLNYIWLGLMVLAVIIGGCTDQP